MCRATSIYKRHRTQTHRTHIQEKYKVFQLKKKLLLIGGVTPTPTQFVVKQITYRYSEVTSSLEISLRSQPLLQKVTSAE